MISFHIAIISYDLKDSNHWYSLLLENDVFGPKASKISSTIVADFGSNVPCAGMFVLLDEQTATWIHYIHVLITAKVPVYIAWGPAHSSPHILKAFKKLYPTVEIAFVLSTQLGPPPAVQGYPLQLARCDSTSQSDSYSDFVDHNVATGPHDPMLDHAYGREINKPAVEL